MRFAFIGIGFLSLALAVQSMAAPGGASASTQLVGHLQYRADSKPQIVLSVDENQAVPLEATRSSGNLARLARQQKSNERVTVSGVLTDTGSLRVISVTPFKGELIKDYFPLKKGHTWFFKDSQTNEEFNINVQGNQTINGVNAWNVQRTRTGMAHDYDLISLQPTGIYLHKRFVRGNTIDLLPAVKFCDAELVAGKLFQTEPAMVNPATGNKTIWTARIDKFENKVVPAGTFPCVRITLTIKDKGLGTRLAEVTMWYGKGVGNVCRQGQFFGVFVAENLLRYTLVP